jgi:hypothetical protein
MNTNRTCLSHLASVLLGMKNVSDKSCRENQYTHFMWLFFFENLTFYEMMWRHISEPVRPEITMWSMRIACWITKTKSTLSQYVILIAFPPQQWLQERASLLRDTYIACLVLTWHESKLPSRQKVGSGANNQLWYFITILHFTYGMSKKVSLQ